MSTFSPLPIYLVGAATIGLGMNAVLAPKGEYPRFGLPLEAPKTTDAKKIDAGPAGDDEGAVSPFIYLKGIREFSYGLTLIALQYQGNEDGVTTFIGVFALAALGDGILVWKNGGDKLKQGAFRHWGGFVGLAAWAAYRGFIAYGQWAQLHALHA